MANTCSARQPHLTSAELRETHLEAQANQLLFASVTELGRGDHPFYSTGYIRRLGTSDERAASETEAAHPEPPPLAPVVIYALMRRARLTGIEADLVRTVARGLQASRAAQVLGIHPRRAARLLRKAIAKLSQHADQVQATLEDQLAWVQHEEQRRRAAPRETHCKRGQEACRGTGLCVRRWYLHERP